MATFCEGIVQNIERTECIGKSREKINDNFSGLEAAGCDLENKIEQLTTSLASGFVGSISCFPSKIAPTGWLALSGQQVSRTTYSALWSFAQSSGNLVTNAEWTSLSAYGSFSQGDGSTTFRLPDLRGHFVRGSGTHNTGTTAGAFGVKQNPYSGYFTLSAGFGGDDRRSLPYDKCLDYISFNGQPVGYTRYQNFEGPYNIDITSGDPRPANIALLYCIKY